MPAALDDEVGRLRGLGCRVWTADLYLHVLSALGLNPIAQVNFNDFKKMYRHGLGVTTGFCGLHHVVHFTKEH